MIPLVAPTITRRDREYLASHDSGGEVLRFEEDFASYVSAEGAVAVRSGTDAIRLALDVLGIQSVSIPTYACTALLDATQGRARRYVDSAFTVRTGWLEQEPATVAVAMFGSGMTAKAAIEDWTLSLGYPHQLPKGALGVCSTHESKMISTGHGGVVYGNDLETLTAIRRLAFRHGLGTTTSGAALGRSQLRQLPEFISRRRKIAATYSAAFEQAGIECPDPDFGSVFFRYMIRIEGDPADAVAELAARGIEAGRGVYPLLHWAAGADDARFPGACHSVNTLLSVPCHPSLTDKQVRYIAEQVVQVCAP